ncbi:iron ABC transporter substrate-binding protein [Mycolicibacterium litorale]|uniref:Iron ABC transporter substrate-binding protein n=1 Tax=Mycolicibacterium litorale TaxID=758802 RepID=A0A6S6P2H3_9MYCO|nr:iron ABC transporter substrate-binding protein [Mycolicibacterium litorale]
MKSVGSTSTQFNRRCLGKAVAAMGVVASLVLTSCGDSGTAGSGAADSGPGTAAETLDKFNAMTGQERTDALVKAAEAEGTVVFYTAASGMDPVIAAFEDKYDISVEMYSGQSDTVLQRILQEYGAGFYGADVLDDSESFSISDQGMTYEYINPELTDRIPGYDPETNVAATRLSVYTQGWNTNLVNEDELPDTLDGFTDPKWKGKLSIDPRDWIWYTGVMDYYTTEKGWTEEQVDDMISTLASYSTFNAGHTVQAQLLLAGEFPVSLSVYTQSIDRLLEKDPNAPVAWRKSDGSFIEPLIFQSQGATILKNAPHPAAAMLFVDFLLTEGQEILANDDRTPTAVPLPGGPLDGIPEDKLFSTDPEKFTTGREEWTKRFDAVLGQK